MANVCSYKFIHVILYNIIFIYINLVFRFFLQNFIGNERRRRRKRSQEIATSGPPQKLRQLNGYNQFCKEFFSSEGTVTCTMYLVKIKFKKCIPQWNLSIPDTIWTTKSILYKEVSLFQRLIYAYLLPKPVSSI